MTQAQEIKAAEAVARWLTEARTALGPVPDRGREARRAGRGSEGISLAERAGSRDDRRAGTADGRHAKGAGGAEGARRGRRELLATTAVPKATVELATAKVAEPTKKAAPTAIAKSTPTVQEITARLDAMTVAQLRKLAADSGLSTVTKLTKKSELVAALTRAVAHKAAKPVKATAPVKRTTTTRKAPPAKEVTS
jgi:hypothetical protein